MERARDLDGLRLIAAMGVVLLHAGEFPELPAAAGEAIRMGLRWAVPFFFLAAGYFLRRPGAEGADATLARVVRMARIFAVAALVFAPMYLAKAWVGGTAALEPKLLLFGTWYHLWFLNALLIGLVVIAAAQPARHGALVLHALSVGLLAAFLVWDMAASINPGGYGGGMMLFRQLLGVPLLWGGYCLARGAARPSLAVIWALIAGGLALALADGLVMARFGGVMGWREGSAGSMMMAAGLLLLGLRGGVGFPDWMARIGREDALGIYVLHPYFIAVAGVLVTRLTGERPSLAVAALAAGGAIVTVAALRVLAPRAKLVLDGGLPAPRAAQAASGAA